ncbi:cysteine dioxygenase Cdg1p [Diutina catenulata]
MLVLPKTQKATVSQGCGTPTKPQRKVYPIDSLEVDLPASSGLNRLVCQLREMLQGQGLSSEDIDIDAVKQAMEEYTSNELEWQHMALHDASRGYSRNGVVNINGNANMLLLVWSPGKSSAIHDHANAHCCMKILKGSLMESLYDVPDHEGQMVAKKHTELTRDQVGYISDDIGLHKISNPTDDYAVSLHVYTPPYASINGCSMYESNGRKHHVDMSKYYSWQGQLVNSTGHSTC